MSDNESDVVMMCEESDFEEAMSDSEDEFLAENVSAKKSSKGGRAPAKKALAAKAKKSSKAALAQNKNAGNVAGEIVIDPEVNKKPFGGSKTKKTIEQTYQKKTQLEHILLRPDTYIGSAERVTQPMYILDAEKEKIVEREITFTPGLYKIFDEIVVNAADNKQRDPNMNEIHIDVNPEANIVSVKNNGKGIPIAMHKEHNCYVPTLIFGHLLTGSNFDDNEKKTTGGRNGYGAKLANIFSTEFTVECLDAANGLKFKQVFRNNMSVAEEPEVKNCTVVEKKKGDYTKISFKPDLPRFKMTILDQDSINLLSKRAYDIAGSMANRHGKKLSVTLNGKKLSVSSFQDYLKLFEGINPPSAYEKIGNRWEIGVSPSQDGAAQQISFVNAIACTKGGGHVQVIVDQLTEHLKKTLKKKNKGGTEIKPAQIKNHLCVFVNCLVENPTFDSQTKENCTTKPSSLKSEVKLTEKFLKQVDKSGVVDSILSYAQFKQRQDLKRKGGAKKVKLTGIAKLDDANFAGSAKSKDCSLIITEGDSAKTLAMSGLSVVGRDYYGVFPLRGKPLNVRDATHAAIMKNEEIKNLLDILGLKFDVVYDETNIKTLRYGRLMIMADQDHDGSHIKGLVINFIHKYWPSLLDIPGFLQQFITPIVKATKGRETKTFFTVPEYEVWAKSDASKGYTIKYYKGLGTSTAEEAKEYFANLDKHEVRFGRISDDTKGVADVYGENIVNVMEVDEDANGEIIVPDKTVSGDDLIDMVFRKDRVEDRKMWLNNLKEDTYLDYNRAQAKGVRYSDFINRELILFSKSDNMRSIPHFVDGFKPSQRKVLFACFKRNLKREVKVAQLAGSCSEISCYHHGEASLQGTIVGMAQNFVGSNNINLLTPSGQFGTRRMGGKDAASARYIFTKLENITRTVFHPDDDELLNYLEDDGMSIEPDYYVPVIPLILVNGSDGIGTGWSSNVPNFCPRQIIANLRKMIKGEATEELYPKYYGFSGEIIPNSKGPSSYTVEGKIEKVDETTLKITELPIKKWTQDYKEFLEKMIVGDAKNPPEIKDFTENHTDSTVSFTITAEASMIDKFETFKGGLMGKFKLTTTISTSNMNLFDTNGKISKFESAQHIMLSFYDIRLDFYNKRKALLVEKLGRERRILENKARFVEEVCSGELEVSNRRRKDLLHDLKQRGYELFPPKKASKTNGNDDGNGDAAIEEDETDTASDAELARGYEYLLGMKIWSLTFEKAEKLRAELRNKTKELEDLKATKPSEIWLKDLTAIEEALDARDALMEAAALREKKARDIAAKRQNGKKKTRAKNPKKKKKADEWDLDMEDSSDDKGRRSSFLDSDSDDEVVVTKTTNRKKKASPTSNAAAKSAPTKRAPAVATKDVAASAGPTAAATAKPAHATAPTNPPTAEKKEDEIEMSLLDRMKKKLVVSPARKMSKKTKSDFSLSMEDPPSYAAASKKRESTSSTESFSSTPSKKRPSPRDDEDDFFADSDEDNLVVTKPAASKKAKKPASAKKQASKKPAAKEAAKKVPKKGKDSLEDSDSGEEEFDDGSESDSEVEEVVPPRARSGRATTRKPVTYNVYDSDDEFDSDDE